MEIVSANQLKQAVEGLHNCRAKLIGTESVTETFEGRLVWRGMVHVFELKGHPVAAQCYAWSSSIDGSGAQKVFKQFSMFRPWTLQLPPCARPLLSSTDEGQIRNDPDRSS